MAESGKYCCETCGKVFYSKPSYNQHVRNLHSKLQLKCSHCDFVTSNKINLAHHSHVKHQKTLSNKDKPLFCCEECDYVTVNNTYLEEHVKIKHLQERIKCEHCDKTFGQKGILARHIKNIHGIGKTAKEEFRCPEEGCDYVTYSKFQLGMHDSKVHQGVKYSCDECSYSSGYKGDLSRHIKVVHQGLQFKCELCDYSTPKKNYLIGHIIKCHSTKS